MQLKKSTVFCLLIYVGVTFCNFLTGGNIDSIRTELHKNLNDSLKASAYNELAFQYMRINEDSVKSNLMIARSIAIRKNIPSELSRNYSLTGNLNYAKGNTDTAYFYYSKALAIDIAKGFKKNLIQDYVHLGRVYSTKGNIDQALAYLFKALDLAKILGDKKEEADCLFRIAVVYDRQEESEKAITFCENAIEIQKALPDSAGLAYSYHRLGLSHEGIKKYDEALKYLELSYEIRKKIGAKEQYGASLNGIGLVYMDKGEYQKALLKIYDAYKYWLEANDKEGIVIATGNLGELSMLMGDDENALKYFLLSNKLSEEIHALSFQKGSLRALAELYFKRKDYKTAYDYFSKYSDLRDKLYSDENSQRMMQMESKYQTEKKEQTIQLLTKEKQLHESELGQKRFFVNALLIGGLLLILLAFLIYNRSRLKQKANDELQKAFSEIEQKNDKLIEVFNIIEQNRDVLALKNKEITDSIKYAKRLQEAILPTDNFIHSLLPDSFVFYKPKDIVSGDFYWFEKYQDSVLFAAVDCTGHGVPGAFMSIVGYNLLNQAVNESGISQPDLILNAVNKNITKTLRQSEEDSVVKDGMDIGLCSINKERTKLEYAGAYNSLWMVRNKALIEYKADKHPIGLFVEENLRQFTNNKIDLIKGDVIYIYTDGFVDQFGGEKGKKFKYKQLQQLLLQISDKPMEEQKAILDSTIEKWKGNLEQVDDILIIGVR
ncbi:MAG: tetratricopeptide repeat protein, partial [Bacteroidetes bacterium]|nr:tetratricopeptide repeat protein [Bacteroidota bacterium]